MTGRGPAGAHLHRDRVNGVLRPRRGARSPPPTSGGAIPDVADFRVVLEPEETLVGTVNEDWAIESMAGDVFLLGSATWRIRRVEPGTVRVVDAEGASPTVPFWLGEAPARTAELSAAVSELRGAVEALSAEADAGGVAGASARFERGRRRARRGAGRGRPRGRPSRSSPTSRPACAELGALPTTDRFVVERFFDDTGGMQLVVHSPRGARVNRGLGLALRKRFCRTFDFELQAAASDDAIVLSLGPQHSFPLEEVLGFLSPATVRDTLVQAVLPTPMFASRWRWNLSRSLVAPRYRGSRRVPPAIQRMEADDLMAAIFPRSPPARRTSPGPIEIPDHPVVRQTLHDCCTEAMDLDGLSRGAGGDSRSGEVAGPLRRHGDPLGAGRGDPERAPLHVPRRRPARGAPHPGGHDAPWPAARGARPVRARPGGGGERSSSRPGPSCAMPRSCTTCSARSCCARPSRTGSEWLGALAGSGRAMTAAAPRRRRRWVAIECRELAAEPWRTGPASRPTTASRPAGPGLPPAPATRTPSSPPRGATSGCSARSPSTSWRRR